MTLAITDSAVEIALLPKAARSDLAFWREHLEPLLDWKRGVVAEMERIAKFTGVPFGTVSRKFYALRDKGVLGLVDRRLAGPRWWKQSPETSVLPESDKALVKLYCENNGRSSRAAIKQLRADWRKGTVTTAQPVDAVTGYPRGWSIENLERHMPDDFELANARRGRAPAAAFRRLVYTTRAELWVGSHYQFDDMWHDHFVNSFAEKQPGRPLELFSHDLFSARKVRWGVRVRTRDEDGKWNGLTERMTRYILASTLFLDGYSPRGTVLVAEHGTAAIREEIERHLHEFSGGLITIERSGMQGAAPHAGQYPGIRRGNPRMKASLESSNNLTHNVFAALPGQTGPDRQNRPEQLDAMLRDNESLLALYDRLSPARRALIDFPFIELNQFMGIAGELYQQIENDPDHDLEGWVESGNVAQEMLLAGSWQDAGKLMQASPGEQAAVLALIESGSIEARPRKMSRREVWDRGAGDLIKLGGAGIVAILGDDLAQPNPVPVRNGMFVFADAELGPGDWMYEGIVFDPFGRRIRLPEGEKFQVFANPFAPQRLFVRDANGAYLGEARRIDRADRANHDAVLRIMGAAAAEEVDRLAGLRQRHAGEALRRKEREKGAEAAEQSITEQVAQESKADRDAARTASRRNAVASRAASARALLSEQD